MSFKGLAEKYTRLGYSLALAALDLQMLPRQYGLVSKGNQTDSSFLNVDAIKRGGYGRYKRYQVTPGKDPFDEMIELASGITAGTVTEAQVITFCKAVHSSSYSDDALKTLWNNAIFTLEQIGENLLKGRVDDLVLYPGKRGMDDKKIRASLSKVNLYGDHTVETEFLPEESRPTETKTTWLGTLTSGGGRAFDGSIAINSSNRHVFTWNKPGAIANPLMGALNTEIAYSSIPSSIYDTIQGNHPILDVKGKPSIQFYQQLNPNSSSGEYQDNAQIIEIPKLFQDFDQLKMTLSFRGLPPPHFAFVVVKVHQSLDGKDFTGDKSVVVAEQVVDLEAHNKAINILQTVEFQFAPIKSNKLAVSCEVRWGTARNPNEATVGTNSARYLVIQVDTVKLKIEGVKTPAYRYVMSPDLGLGDFLMIQSARHGSYLDEEGGFLKWEGHYPVDTVDDNEFHEFYKNCKSEVGSFFADADDGNKVDFRKLFGLLQYNSYNLTNSSFGHNLYPAVVFDVTDDNGYKEVVQSKDGANKLPHDGYHTLEMPLYGVHHSVSNSIASFSGTEIKPAHKKAIASGRQPV